MAKIHIKCKTSASNTRFSRGDSWVLLSAYKLKRHGSLQNYIEHLEHIKCFHLADEYKAVFKDVLLPTK